ncbi:MAG: putative nucleic acid-binding protein contains domain [Pedosphaera sp.]|nr:putative nucleic acid-binding protein contains domain [Pedosphaera sp.]
MIYLLDTDTFIFMVRGLKNRPNANERQRTRQAMARRILNRCQKCKFEEDEIALSAVTVAELEYGAQNSGDYDGEMDLVRRAMTPFARLSFDADDCAAHYGKIRHALETAGNSIGSLDTLIAAHALSLGATLVTDNTDEFSRVPTLRCQNWAN